MCGSEANKTDDPEALLGLSLPTLSEARLTKKPLLFGKLGVAAFMTPIIAVGIAYIILAAPRQAQAGEFISPKVFDILVVFIVASIIGTIFSICSLWKREGWPIFAIIGLIVNGGFLLGGFQYTFS